MPKPIDHFLVQADLTVVVPGPLQRDLADELATVATVESAGAAMVYRISEQSIRHALDIGKTRDWMHALFAQPLQNAGAARTHLPHRRRRAPAWPASDRHGRLVRAVRGPGAAGPGGGGPPTKLQLRALAPTVAVSPAPIAEVLVALRGAGFAPAAEDSSGSDRRCPAARGQGAHTAAAAGRTAPRRAPAARPSTRSSRCCVR